MSILNRSTLLALSTMAVAFAGVPRISISPPYRTNFHHGAMKGRCGGWTPKKKRNRKGRDPFGKSGYFS